MSDRQSWTPSIMCLHAFLLSMGEELLATGAKSNRAGGAIIADWDPWQESD